MFDLPGMNYFNPVSNPSVYSQFCPFAHSMDLGNDVHNIILPFRANIFGMAMDRGKCKDLVCFRGRVLCTEFLPQQKDKTLNTVRRRDRLARRSK